jgi:CHAD domain-containing protein
MLQLTDQLHRTLPDSGDNSARSAKHFIASQLERLFKKVHKRSRQADPAHPPRLHRLRISIKNLRYALEFFLPQLNHDKSLLRHWQRLLVKTDRLQELLGAINDSHQAETQLRQIANDAPHLSETVALVGAWHAAAHQERMTKLKSLLQELDKIRLPRLKNVRQSTHRHT